MSLLFKWTYFSTITSDIKYCFLYISQQRVVLQYWLQHVTWIKISINLSSISTTKLFLWLWVPFWATCVFCLIVSVLMVWKCPKVKSMTLLLTVLLGGIIHLIIQFIEGVKTFPKGKKNQWCYVKIGTLSITVKKKLLQLILWSQINGQSRVLQVMTIVMDNWEHPYCNCYEMRRKWFLIDI